MFNKISNYFRDPEYPSLGTVVKLLKLTRLWAPSRTRFQNYVHLFTLVSMVILLINQLVWLIITREAEIFGSFIQYSVYNMGVIKILLYHVWHKKWEAIIEKISKIEKEFQLDPIWNEVLTKYENRGHTLIFRFYILALIASISVFVKTWYSTILAIIFDVPSNMRSKVLYIWWPFNQESNLGCIGDLLLQNVYAFVCGIYVTAWDSLLVLIMVGFAGQMQLVKTKFKHSFDSGTMLEQKESMIKCHQTYVRILELHQSCNSLLSPVLFVHLLIVYLNIAVAISNLDSNNPGVFTNALIFMCGQLIQLILYYWNGNETTVQSELVSYSVFESDWVDKDLNTKRLIVLLSLSTKKLVYFNAGPFSRVSLSTFISLLRASYSFFTLLKETENK